MKRFETPEVDEDDNISPEVSKHLSDDPECPGKGWSKPILVLVDDHEAVDLLHLVPKHIHQLLHKLSVTLILRLKIHYSHKKDKKGFKGL